LAYGFVCMPRGRDLTTGERRQLERLEQRRRDAEKAARRALQDRDKAIAELLSQGVSVTRLANALELSSEAIRVAARRGASGKT
jgi:DNA-binding NarL/FixJ family response regulator